MKNIVYIILSAFVLLVSCVDKVSMVEDKETLEELSVSKEYFGSPMTKSDQMPLDSFDINNYPYSFEEDSLYIVESYGVTIISILEDSLCYIVNNEALYLKETLFDRRNTIDSRLLIQSKLDSDEQYIVIEYNNENIDVRELFEEAMNNWNSIPDCNIRFVLSDEYDYDPYWPRCTFLINDDNPKTFYDGNMYYVVPKPNEPSDFVWINSEGVFSSMNDDIKVYTMMHMLGHVVGLDHEDDNNDGYDSASIMMSYELLHDYYLTDWNGFSNSDISKIAETYPLRPTSMDLVFDRSMIVEKEWYEITADVNYLFPKEILNPVYDFEVNDNANVVLQEDGSSKCKICFNESGNYTIKVTLYGGTKNTQRYVYEKEIYVGKNDVQIPTGFELSVPFNISWVYGNGVSVSYTASELYFDGENSQNISITKTSNSHARVTIKDYGDYTVVAKVKNSKGEWIYKKFHFAKFCNPETLGITVNDPLDLQEQAIIVSEPFDGVLGQITDNLEYRLNNDDGSVVEERLVLNLQRNMIQNSIQVSTRRIDHRYYNMSNTVLTIAKGTSLPYELPDAFIRSYDHVVTETDPETNERFLVNYSVTQSEYYYLSVPEDKCEII